MIISASRRTDIPAFYSEWFINRLKAGFAYVKNPRNPNRITSVLLNNDVVDCIVFWTKNPKPMLSKLKIIDKMGYPYYFQFTITPYDQKAEKGLPRKTEIMETFQQLSNIIGKHRVIWRYDPVIVSERFSVQYHLEAFGKMRDILADYTNKCIISFVDLYTQVTKNAKNVVISVVDTIAMNKISQGFSNTAKNYNILLETCSEAVDLSSYGVHHASCIDLNLIEDIIGYSIHGKKDPNQRPVCGCTGSIDIGAYDCCLHGCVYCYATTNEDMVRKNIYLHDPHSPMLVGHPRGDEIMTVRELNSLKIRQSSLF